MYVRVQVLGLNEYKITNHKELRIKLMEWVLKSRCK